MPERSTGKPEIAAQKRTIKLAPAIGDWTTYKPPQVLVKRVKTGLYGFDRLSKDELNLVLLIHYRFLEQLLKSFKHDLNMAIELLAVNVEQTTYLNYLRAVNGPVSQSKIALPDQHDSVSLIFDLPLANTIINYALGSHDLEPPNRGLTEPETTTLLTALTEYLPHYAQAWENTIPNPELANVSSPDITIDSSLNTSATFVYFSAEVSLGDNPPGRILLGYQGNTLKNLLVKYKQQAKQKSLNFSRLSANLLSKIIVPVTVNLGQTYLTTGEIDRLEIGDVVSLDSPINLALPVNLGNFVKLLCQPGLKNKKVGIRISGVNDEEMEVTPPPLSREPAPEKPALPKPLPPKPPVEFPAAVPETKEEDLADDDLLEEDFPEEDFAEEEFEDDFEDEDFNEKEA